MDKTNENINIVEADITYIEKEFKKTNKAFNLNDLSKNIAYQKNASQLSHAVKKYDPNSIYEVDDFIFKEYDELLTVSSKGAEPFKGAIVLRVIKKIIYDNFNCEMLEVDYSGGGTFRKHVDYMKKTNTQVLLPSNLEGKAQTPELLKKEDDPRLSQLPMTEKDLKKLEKNLGASLAKSDKFFSWNDHWQLKEKRLEIQEEKIKEIKKYFQQTNKSAITTDLVTQFLNIEPTKNLFELGCLSLNYTLEKKHKKEFIFVSPDDWGKWTLKETLDSFFENLPLSKPRAKLPRVKKEDKIKLTESKGFPLKLYLTWREILSGGLKIPKSHNREFSHSREFVLTDTEGGRDYIVFYYPSPSIILGLKEFYETHNIPQGASLTLEKVDPTHFNFAVKKSKKKLSVVEVTYNSKEDKFLESGEEVFTFSLPNKIIYLERETLKKLFSMYDQRQKQDLQELLILIFQNFGLGGDNLSLHFHRAYHLVDLLKHTALEDVERILLLSPEFTGSEKNKGLFFLTEQIQAEEEIILKDRAEISPEVVQEVKSEEMPEEAILEIGTIGEIELPEIIEEEVKEEEKEEVIREEIKAEPPSPPKEEAIEEKPSVERLTPPKKEKEAKKKKQKQKIEAEKIPRRRKGERKIIEERIELEESEIEALLAKKAKEKKFTEEEKEEVRTTEKKEEYEPLEPEKPLSGLFGEKLKSALDKKKKSKKKK